MPLSECKEATPAWIGNFWDIPILSVCLCIDHMGHLHMCVHVCRHQRSTSDVCNSSGNIPVFFYSDRVSHWPEAHRRLGWLTSSTRHCLSLPPQILHCKKAALVQHTLYRLSYLPSSGHFTLSLRFSACQLCFLCVLLRCSLTKGCICLPLIALFLFHSHWFGMMNL